MYKAICILRISTTRQDIESQRVDMCKYISNFGYKKDEIYWITGEGASAFKIDDAYKAVINEMFETINGCSSIECVFSWHINRLGRDEEELHKIRKFLVSHKIQLRIKEPTLYLLNEDGTENPGMSLAFSMFATMSRQQIEELRAKSKRAKTLNREKGKYNGGFLMFGYTTDKDNNIIIDNEQSNIVKKIFYMFVSEKKTYAEIARELMSTGELWHTNQHSCRIFVSNLCNNPIYAGKHSTESRSAMRHNYKSYTGISYPPIISDEYWQRICERSGYTKELPKRFRGYIYYGLDLLYHDGQRLTAFHNTCQYGINKLHHPDLEHFYVNINMIDSLLWYHTLNIIKSRASGNVKSIRADLRSKQLLYINKQNVCQKKIEALEEEITRIENRIIKGRLDEEVGDKMQDKCYNEMLNLRIEIDTYNKYLEEISIELEKTVKDDYIQNHEIIEDDNERRDVIRKYITHVEVSHISKYVYSVNVDGVEYEMGCSQAHRYIKRDGKEIEFEYLQRFKRKH